MFKKKRENRTNSNGLMDNMRATHFFLFTTNSNDSSNWIEIRFIK